MSTKFIPKKAFLKTLPKKRISVGIVILNQANEVLMVKPTYKDHWTLPGGVVDQNESPREACIRETLEETGLKIKPKLILATLYTKDPKYSDESIHLMFFAGKINQKRIDSIITAKGEIEKFQFVCIDELHKFNKKFAIYAQKYKKEIIEGINFGYMEVIKS
jgi:8-oxo-dGTP diphosphatase